MGDLRVPQWNSGLHDILASRGLGRQVGWKCSCGSGGRRTTQLLIHMIAIADTGEDISMHFERETVMEEAQKNG